ncbi:hypothetical protein N8083_00555 [Candidatus Pacebacteria bacterium]|nr:hypothetical protein [Candidatus Paceibacterota bacterium]
MPKGLSKTKQPKPASSSATEARDFLIKRKAGYSTDTLLEELAEMLDNDIKNDKAIELFFKSQHALGLDTHVPVAESVPYEHRYLITEFINRTEEEYQCETAIEKSLAEVIALSYIRIISISKTMSGYLAGQVGVNRDINDFFTIASKELDRAHRQLTNTIMTLRQIKVVSTPMNIKANTAFISNNQQINNHGKEK